MESEERRGKVEETEKGVIGLGVRSWGESQTWGPCCEFLVTFLKGHCSSSSRPSSNQLFPFPPSRFDPLQLPLRANRLHPVNPHLSGCSFLLGNCLQAVGHRPGGFSSWNPH